MHDADEQYEQFERDESAPVDMLAALFEARGWSFELDGEDEITAEYKGSWASYQIRAIWREEDNALQLIVLPDVTVPSDKRTSVYTALGLINEQLWLGHFDMWSANGILLFRHGSLMPRQLSMSPSTNASVSIRCSNSSFGVTKPPKRQLPARSLKRMAKPRRRVSS
jgi:hypothetical protein